MNTLTVIILLVLACAVFFIVKKQRDDKKKPPGEPAKRYAVEVIELQDEGAHRWLEIYSADEASAASGYASLHARSQGVGTRVRDRQTDQILFVYP